MIALLALALLTNSPVTTNEFEVSWIASPDTNVTGYYVYDGTYPYDMSEQFDAGNGTNLLVDTTNALPLLITMAAHTADGTQSPLAADVVFNGIGYTNIVMIFNPSGMQVKSQSGLTSAATVTNFNELDFTNPPGNQFFSGWGLYTVHLLIPYVITNLTQ